MDHISIIVVNYDTPKETKDCLTSLLQIEAPNFAYNIILVDNGSIKPFSLPSDLQVKNLEMIRSEANLGFTGGNNLGISYAIKKYQPDFFLLINSDTLVTKNFLTELYSTAKQEPRFGLVTPKIYFAKNYEFYAKDYHRAQKGKVLWYAGGTIDWNSLTAFHRGVDEVDRTQFDSNTDTDFATGCCMLIKRELVERIGILDKKFFLYSEDVDYSLRAKKAGFKILFNPKSEIWHLNAGSTEGVGSKIQQYYQTKNRLLVTFKHGSNLKKILAARLMFKFLKQGNPIEKKAVIDLLLGKFGKQTVV